MKKTLMFVTVFCLLFVGSVFAESLVCDAQQGIDRYRVLGLDPARTIVPAQSDGSVNYDVSTLIPGPYNATIEAGKPWLLDGQEQPAVRYSDPVPFVLTAPAKPVNTSGLGVEP